MTRACFAAVMVLQHGPEQPCDLPREKGRDRVSNLYVLLGAVAMKEVVVGEGLESRRLPHGEAPDLTRIGMNEVMTVLREVARNRGTGAIAELYPKAVVELSRAPVCVKGYERVGKIKGVGRPSERVSERRGVQVTGEIVRHVCLGLVVRQPLEVFIQQPLPEIARTTVRQVNPTTRIAIRWSDSDRCVMCTSQRPTKSFLFLP